jgi:hypothetical protein
VNDPIFSPPAAVRPAAVDALLAEAQAEHDAGRRAEQVGLEHYRRAGEALLKAKEAAGHGNWLAVLSRCKIPQQRASEYMRLAQGWGELPPGGSFTLKGALSALASKREGGDYPERGEWSEEVMSPEGEELHRLMRWILDDNAWNYDSEEDMARCYRLMDRQLFLLRSRDIGQYDEHFRRHPFFAVYRCEPGSYPDLDSELGTHQGEHAEFATLEEAVAWVRDRGDRGLVRHEHSGTVYRGSVPFWSARDIAEAEERRRSAQEYLRNI